VVEKPTYEDLQQRIRELESKIEKHHDLERVTEWLNDNIASGNKTLTPNEYRVVRKDGEILYVRTAGVIERKEGEAPRVFATVRDLSDLKRTEKALVRRSEFERLISEISSEFLGLPSEQIDSGIERALADIASFSGADRAYVFLLQDDGVLVDNTHEWCAEGIEPQIKHLRNIPLDEELPWFAKHFRKGKVLHVPDVAQLPTEARLDRAHFQAQNILSMVVVPMLLKGRSIGFLGFDSVRKYRTWTEDDRACVWSARS